MNGSYSGGYDGPLRAVPIGTRTDYLRLEPAAAAIYNHDDDDDDDKMKKKQRKKKKNRKKKAKKPQISPRRSVLHMICDFSQWEKDAAPRSHCKAKSYLFTLICLKEKHNGQF